MPELDLALLNATVVDGTGSPSRVADVGIRGDRVEYLGPSAPAAKRVVDLYGRTVTPGFVDLHGHSDYSLLADPFAHSKLFQGVTTEVGGNCGYHGAPIFGRLRADRIEEQKRTLGIDIGFASASDYAKALAQARPAINYAQQVGYNTLRAAVTNEHAKPLSNDERQRLRELVKEQLAFGYVGLSYGLAYSPACFSRTEELTDVAEVAQQFASPISFHLRDEGDGLVEALEEALFIGRASGAATHIGHLKTFRRHNWSKLDRVLAMLDEARAKGMSLTVDRYPHVAMNTLVKFALPAWALEGGNAGMRARLNDPVERAKVVAELGPMFRQEERHMLLSLVSLPQNRQFEGRFIDDIAKSLGVPPEEFVCRLVAEEGDLAFATFFGMSRDNLDRILGLPYSVVASDASVQAIHRQAGGGRPHPRCFDTFPYFLAEWVYERKLLTLERAVEKITSMPARVFGLRDRGQLGEGQFADVVALTPERLLSAADYEQPIRFPRGIDLVIVNGQLVLQNGRLTSARPGRFLKRAEA